MNLALVPLAVFLAVAPVEGGTPAAPADVTARLDALHARRDDPGALRDARSLADAAVARAPSDYGVLWRAARALFDQSEDKRRSEDERSALAKQAYDLAQRAIAVNPNDVAAQYWAALSIGNYAQNMGVVRALANGIEGKFKRPLERATALDVTYDHGNIPAVWAAYYLELPWPKRDRDKAAQQLKQSLQINPNNLRARLYQARIAADQGHKDEARALLAQIAAAPVGRYDPPAPRADRSGPPAANLR